MTVNIERGEEGSSTVASDSVLLEGAVFYGYHGVHAEEQHLGQRFVVDIEAHCDLRQAAASDDVEATISYSDLYRLARQIVEGPPHKLIEAVAEQIASSTLEAHAAVEEVTVTVRKPHAPIKGAVFENAGVKIHRKREP